MIGSASLPRLALVRVNERLGVHPFLRETNVSGVYPALGVAYLAAAARRAGAPVSAIDAHALNLDEHAVVRRLEEDRPRVVGLTSTTFNWPVAAALARAVRRSLPKTTILIGGPHLSLYPEECLSEPAFDAAVVGEGDETLIDLLACIDDGVPLTGTPGTVVRHDGAVVRGPERPPIADLDGLPLPAFDLLPIHRYRSLTLPRPFVSMVTSRGCPYRCRFCSQAYVGGAYRRHGVQRILQEMERAIREFHAREIVFFDETFTLDRARVLELCRGILGGGLRPRFNIRTRADLLDDEVLEALRAAGCSSIHVGIEAGTERIRTARKRRLDLDTAVGALRRARKLGIETRGYFMLGYPTETPDEIEQTIRLACELSLDWASFTITLALPGTDIYRDLIADAEDDGDYWRAYAQQRFTGPPGYASDTVPADELEALLRRAYRRFYLRPGLIAGKLVSGRLWRQLPSTARTAWEIAVQPRKSR